MFEQKGKLIDYIFPLIRATKTGDTYNYEELIATGFFIGSRGYALTAGHVINQLFDNLPANGVVLALFADDESYWHPYEVTGHSKHPTEDVGIIKIDGDWWKSIIEISTIPAHSGVEYHCWGYPKVVAQEIMNVQEGAMERPELIFTQGYIRRRISRELEVRMFVGTQFYELSEIVGEGNSGGPIIFKKSVQPDIKWKLIGIYMGEKEGNRVDISYAVRSEAFLNWQPDILDKTIIEEANGITNVNQ